MVPPFGQDVASVAPFSGRLASPSLLPSCNNKQERREASFIEGRNPFWHWGKEQRLGYLQQQCTQWSLRVPRLANLRWGDGKVATLHGICRSRARLSNICMPQGRDGVQVVALSIRPLCRHDITRSDRQIGNVSVTYVTLVPWWRERRRYVPMPQSWTTAGCLGLCLGSSVENLMSGCTCRPFIPVCTGRGSGMQIPLANIHWRFLFTEMIGASR